MNYQKTLLIFLIPFVIPICSNAQTNEENLNFNSILSVDVGFSTSINSSFRDVYGSGFKFGITYDRYLNNLFLISGKIKYSKFDKIIEDLDFRTFSTHFLIGMYRQDKVFFRRFAEAGIGLNYRTVIANYALRDSYGQILGYQEVSYSEFDLSLLVSAGFFFHLSDNVTVSTRINFDHFPFGDTDRGQFGNTGGFNFSLGLGLNI